MLQLHAQTKPARKSSEQSSREIRECLGWSGQVHRQVERMREQALHHDQRAEALEKELITPPREGEVLPLQAQEYMDAHGHFADGKFVYTGSFNFMEFGRLRRDSDADHRRQLLQRKVKAEQQQARLLRLRASELAKEE